MYGREFFHESVVKDIVDVITSLKDYDEVQFLTNSASKRSFKSYDDDGRIQTDIKLNCKFRKADIDIIINEDSFLVYLILPMTADKEVQKEMAEFLTRINYGLESCNFEIDFSDGEIRCKCFCNCADTVPTNQQISNCIFFNTMQNKFDRNISPGQNSILIKSKSKIHRINLPLTIFIFIIYVS